MGGVRTLAASVVGAVVVVAAGCSAPPPVDPGTTTSTTTTVSTVITLPPTTTVPQPVTRVYMTDNIDYGATPSGTAEASVDMKVTVRGCADVDSCSGGVRRSSGYTWFSALQVNVGSGAGYGTTYGMHGGLAFGGSGNQAQMYLDWSGYCPSNLGGAPLRDGGTACATASANPTQKPHTVTGLDTSRTYRVSVVRRTCSVSEVTDVAGPLTGWELTATDLTTGTVRSGGTWCLPNADRVEYASAFNEVIEGYANPTTSNGPCTTDFGSLQLSNARYRTGSTWTAFPHAAGRYNGNQTDLDANCANANLRSPAVGVVIDERMTPKGANGGLVATGWLNLF